MKFHFISSVVMTIMLGIMAVNDSQSIRMIMILPTLIMYQLTFILFQLECDTLHKIMWSVKEKNLRKSVSEETAEKIVRYYRSNHNI